MNIEATVDFQVRSTLFSMARMYNQKVQKLEITHRAGYVLIIIPREGIPATSIAPIMGMGSSSLSRLLKSMENNGTIYRKASESDKRISRVFLTPRGVELRAEIKKIVVCFNKSIQKQVNPEDLLIYNKVSKQIRNQIEADMKPSKEKK
ncbi:MAG: MarR family transcriptional regulator [Bacteroidetes bacterium 4572_77]|nr:MAG: MarR family transcriptional regulator [Bacteroidetes bacterium 4572_77]